MEPIEWIAFALMAALEVGGALWQNKASKDMNKDSQAWNEKMVNESNEYNTPAAQMQRMQDAGINTAMMGESGASTVLSGSRSASPLSPSLLPMVNPFSQFGGSASSSFSNYAKGKSDLSLLDAQKQQIIENTQKLRAETANIGLSSEAQSIINKYADARELWAINGMKADVHLSYAQQAHFNQLVKESQYNLTNILPAELQKIVSETNKNVLDLDVMLAQIRDYEASAEYTKAQTGLTGLQADQISAQTEQIQTQTSLTQQESENYQKLTDKYLEKYGAEIDNIKAQTGLTAEQSYWMVFDKVANTDLTILGNRISRNRFGEAAYRKSFEKAVKSRLERFSR